MAAAIAGVGAHAEGTTHDVLEQVKNSQQEAARTGHVFDPERLRVIMDERLAALDAARNTLRDHRGELDGETLSTLIQELDLEEQQVKLALGVAGQSPD